MENEPHQDALFYIEGPHERFCCLQNFRESPTPKFFEVL
jgi:hypothetical protein